jgi:ABC-type Fe3+/spermidine/putrescine transport system ATPase subunit
MNPLNSIHPNNLFVAHFIGEFNFLEDSIDSPNGTNYAEIELPEGLEVKVVNLRIKLEERVVLV